MKVSVIIPVYNVATYLDDCLKSVVSQSYRNLEIIAVDDCSTDSSGSILDEWAKKDSRIRVIHKENGGLSSARNAALDVATGDYIAMIDSDDFWDCDAVETMFSLLTGNNADMVIARGRRVDVEGNELPGNEKGMDTHYEGVISEEEFWKERARDMFYVVAWSKLYKRELFDDIRFPEGKINEDVAVLWKIVCKCKKIVATEKKIYSWRQRDGSITRSEFGYRNMFLPHALLEEVQYVKKTDISERAKYFVMENAFLQTSRILSKAYIFLNDPEQIKEADDLYLKYRPIAKEIREKAEFSERKPFFVKLRMTLFLLSKSRYFAICKIKRG